MPKIVEYAFFICLTLYFGGSTIWSHTREERTRSRPRVKQLKSWGRDTAVFGGIVGIFGLYLGISELRWLLVGAALVVGCLAGALVGWHSIKRWDRELREQGRLQSRPDNYRARQSWALLVWLLLLVVLTPLLIPSQLPPLADKVASALWFFPSMLFLVWGLCVWLWAAKQESQVDRGAAPQNQGAAGSR